MFQSYGEVCTYLDSLIRPHAAVRGASGSIITPLERMRFFLEKLGNPHMRFKSVVVTGTSGKGSTAYLLANALFRGGYHVGLTTSPHLQKINERIQIDGVCISDADLIELINELLPVIYDMQGSSTGAPSYYEVLAAAAFLHFSRQPLDLVVVEVGLESKYEASNLLSPFGVILTNISLDHTPILGNTIGQIAKEAVSAIHQTNEKSFVVTGVSQSSVLKIVEHQCKRYNADLAVLRKDFVYVLQEHTISGSRFRFQFKDYSMDAISLSLIGDYQVENASLVLATLSFLRKYNFSVSEGAVRSAFSTAFFPGRFERVFYKQGSRSYEIVLDGAHNEAKMDSFLRSLCFYYGKRTLVFVLAFKKGKHIKKMLESIFKVADRVIVTSSQVNTDMSKNSMFSAKDVWKVVKQLPKTDIPVDVESISRVALEKAFALVEEDDLIVTTGSLYLVGEIRQYLHLPLV